VKKSDNFGRRRCPGDVWISFIFHQPDRWAPAPPANG
jgi:hypothetical protein